MMQRAPGRGWGPAARDDRHVRPRRIERVDSGQNLPARAPVVFREIDFDPWQAATLDGPQRTTPAERIEGRGEPLPPAAVGDQAAHLFDEHRCARWAELSHP